ICIAISKLVILPVILPLIVAMFLRAALKRLSSFLIVSSMLSSTILLIYAILMVRTYAELFIPFVGSLVEHGHRRDWPGTSEQYCWRFWRNVLDPKNSPLRVGLGRVCIYPFPLYFMPL